MESRLKPLRQLTKHWVPRDDSKIGKTVHADQPEHQQLKTFAFKEPTDEINRIIVQIDRNLFRFTILVENIVWLKLRLSFELCNWNEMLNVTSIVLNNSTTFLSNYFWILETIFVHDLWGKNSNIHKADISNKELFDINFRIRNLYVKNEEWGALRSGWNIFIIE